jgi:integrase
LVWIVVLSTRLTTMVKAKVLPLPAGKTKKDKPKRIPINHHVRGVLEALPSPINRDLHGSTYLGNPIEVWKIPFESACKAAGILHGRKCPNGINFHDIRATVKTNMLDAGVDKAYRDMILGHSLQGMDVHYLRTVEGRLKDAMD